MRKPIMAGNWKLQKLEAEAVDFVEQLKPLIADVKDREILVCPTYVSLSKVNEVVKGSNISLGAQDVYWEDAGAFTGEVSAPMLKAVGCSHTLIGHSERRQYFGETDETVNKKVKAALKHGLQAVVCVGETLAQREANETMKVVGTQVKEGLKGLEIAEWEKIVIAYEPVWAIGTGKTASPEQAQEVHKFIRGLLPKEVAEKVRILYGGSVNPANVKELMAKPDIDGGLVGGASLKVDSFVQLIKH